MVRRGDRLDGPVDGEGKPLTGPSVGSKTCYIADMAKTVRPSDLPTKRVRAPDGTIVQMKVVQSDSDTLALDLLAAFRSNVRRIKTEQRKHDRADRDAAQA